MELTNTAATASSSPFAALLTIFYDPAKTFASLEQRRAAWLPVILLLLITTVLMLWYFSVVDFAWLMDQMFATIKDPGQRERAQAMMSKQMMLASTIGGALIGLPIVFALIGVYFMFVGKMYAKDFTFGKGFALTAWSYVPSLLALPLGGLQIILSPSGQMGFSDLNPLSLNTLFFHHPLGHPMASLLDSISVISVWTAVLMVIGFQVWAKVKRSAAVKVVLIPNLVIYGIWFAYALSKAA